MSRSNRTSASTRTPTAAPWQTESHRRSIMPLALPGVDAQDMLQLMRSTRGRMQGNLSLRAVGNGAEDWVYSYCYIDAGTASLRFELSSQTAEDSFEILVPDLRGCQACAIFDDLTRTTIIELTYRDETNRDDVVQLRPERQTYFSSWYAALLCWQSCKPHQRISGSEKSTKAKLKPILSEEASPKIPKNVRVNAPLRTEKALLLTEGSPDFSNLEYPNNTTATEVSCILRGNGELSIHTIRDRRTLINVQLHSLPRSAIARLGKNVFGLARTLAIYPQYGQSRNACSTIRPIYLSFNYTDSYEVMVSLLRAFSLPEFHQARGPRSKESDVGQRQAARSGRNPGSRFFRLDHALSGRVNKAQFLESYTPSKSSSQFQRQAPDNLQVYESSEYYVEVLVDEQIKAKTPVRASVKSTIFWAEGFDLRELPAFLSSLSFRLKKRQLQESGTGEPSETASVMTSKTGLYIRTVHSALDTVEGTAEVELDQLDPCKDHDLTCQLSDEKGLVMGELSVSVRREEHVILAESEYDHLLGLIQTFSNDLTLEIFERTPLRPADLANCLLNIFQASGTAEMWLRFLIRDEIYNSKRQQKKEISSSSAASDERSGQSKADKSGEDAMARTNEALLLFRSNNLLSRALDSYMRRLGQAYLETTLRVKLQDIMDEEEYCEVDPSRLIDGSNHEANWQRLMKTTKDIWSFIRHSTFNCPKELRRIFRTIRDMATDRFGQMVPSKRYTSVSSFLFLRFFCTAISSPKLFGLLKGEPGPNAQRTYMLVAKSLQGLANMSTFGNKEHWMAPMNAFCSANRSHFEAFINDICNVQLYDLNDPSLELPGKEDESVSDISRSESASTKARSSTTVTRSPIHENQNHSQPGDTDLSERPSNQGTAPSTDQILEADAVLDHAAENPLLDSKSGSPSDFNVLESAAYSNSFATEFRLPSPRPITPDAGMDGKAATPDESQAGGSDSLVEQLRRNNSVGRASIASTETVVYVGPSSRRGKNSHQSLNAFNFSSQTDEANKYALPIGDEQGESPRDDSDTNKPTGTKDRDISASPSTHANTDSLHNSTPSYSPRMSLSSFYTEQEADMTQVATETGSQGHDTIFNAHKRLQSLDSANEDRIVTTQVMPATLSVRPSIGSLKARPSLDLEPNDPLRLILERLSAHAREGFLSLPGLIDPAKNLALLVNIWMDSLEVRIHRAAAAAAAKGMDDDATIAPIIKEIDDLESSLAQFHNACQELRDKTGQYHQSAEKKIRGLDEGLEENEGITAINITAKWVSTAERMEASPHEFWIARERTRPVSRASSSSLYPSTLSSQDGAPSSFYSRRSADTISRSSIASAAPPPPAISRDPRNRKSRATGTGLFGGSSTKTDSQGAAEGASGRASRWAKTPSINSSGSDKTGKESKVSAGKSSTKSKKKSPERSAEANAMRKLGWM